MGRTYHGRGRIYLVGGTHMVYDGFRAQTQDVDYVAQLDNADDQDFIRAVRTLIRDLSISVEPAGPGDFIPLPSGWQERSRFIGRFGNLEAFTFDPVSTALSKIERGSSQDIDDILKMLAAGLLHLDQIEAAFEEIAPRLESESLRVDEEDFRRKLVAFLALAGEPGPASRTGPGDGE